MGVEELPLLAAAGPLPQQAHGVVAVAFQRHHGDGKLAAGHIPLYLLAGNALQRHHKAQLIPPRIPQQLGELGVDVTLLIQQRHLPQPRQTAGVCQASLLHQLRRLLTGSRQRLWVVVNEVAALRAEVSAHGVPYPSGNQSGRQSHQTALCQCRQGVPVDDQRHGLPQLLAGQALCHLVHQQRHHLRIAVRCPCLRLIRQLLLGQAQYEIHLVLFQQFRPHRRIRLEPEHQRAHLQSPLVVVALRYRGGQQTVLPFADAVGPVGTQGRGIRLPVLRLLAAYRHGGCRRTHGA